MVKIKKWVPTAVGVAGLTCLVALIAASPFSPWLARLIMSIVPQPMLIG